MTIVEKVINLLKDKKTLSLKEIYSDLSEHTPSSIRGNINRYLGKTKNPKISRVEKGVYSIVEVLSVENTDTNVKKISYMNECKFNNKRIAFFHKDFETKEDVNVGLYTNTSEYNSYSKMMNDYESLYSVIVQGDCREILKRLKSNSFDCMITDPAYKVISGGTSDKKGTPSGILKKNDGKIFKENNITFKEWLSEAYRVLKEGSHAYVFTNFVNLEELMRVAKEVGFKLHNLLCWEKNTCTPNRWYMSATRF